MTFRSHGSLITATTETTQFVLDTTRGVPELLYIGPPLEPTDLDDLAGVLERPRAKAALDVDTPAQILPEHGSGWQGQPGLRGHRPDGSGWAPRFSPERVDFEGDRCSVRAVDTIAELAATTEFDAMPDSVRIRVRLENLGETTYQLDECTMAIPFADEAAEVVHLTGRWSHEFQITRTPLTTGALRFDNRRGRTSHDRVPAVFVTSSGATNTTGSVLGVALGWSGNTIVTVEALTSGHRVVQMGEQLSPGELQLEPGESYTSPWMEVATSAEGLNGVSQAFHRSIRTSESVPGVDRPRPVVLNTWEAVYFNHDLETLTALADAGAEVGVERFVLDDGWFRGRRDDTAGLGDWWVDEHVWPDGLGPLVDHVTGLGLEFGLWFEPEMVNRDSDLYRTHPEWVLSTPGYEPVEGRNQLVLDLGRAEVVEYLREKIHAVLSSYDISYVKWDMNRDLVHASSGSRAGTHHFMHGVYRLWDELQALHPNVEIESCASGGGRADFEILSRAARIWTSDSNDAHERQRIQQGFSLLFPPEVMGAHIGPPRSHTSGRVADLSFRIATAFFGHFGIEWNLLSTTPEERSQLAEAISLHKQHRALLHGGVVHRLDHPDPNAVAHVVVAEDRGEAMVSYAQLDLPPAAVAARLRIVGLDPDRRYVISRLPLPADRAATVANQVGWLNKEIEATGRVLATVGLQMPMLDPDHAVIIHLSAR